MFNKEQLTELVEETLKEYNLHSDSAVNLILGTIAQESAFGTYLKQLGGGPALGICQMEPATVSDIWGNFLEYRGFLRDSIIKNFGFRDYNEHWHEPPAEELVHNLKYSILMCRVHYLRQRPALPHDNDIPGLAQYWKKFYNTELGKGTEEEFINNYHKYLK